MDKDGRLEGRDRMRYVKATPVNLAASKEFDEAWLEERIVEDPSLLGLGDLVVRDRQRIQKSTGGRLDLLLQNLEGNVLYEVEIQLGETDPSHLVRTLEYWDVERKRYPMYEHVAVIVAEDVTTRFLNVIGLFNSVVPLIAIQLNAFQRDDAISIVCVRVLDVVKPGTSEEEFGTPASRETHEARQSPESMTIAGDILKLIREIEPNAKENYTHSYIGQKVGNRVQNFVTIYPRRNPLVLAQFKIAETGEMDEWLEQQSLSTLSYQHEFGSYQVKITLKDMEENLPAIRTLIQRAYQQMNGIDWRQPEDADELDLDVQS